MTRKSFLVVALLAGCAHAAELHPGAEHILIVTSVPTDGQYAPIADVSCNAYAGHSPGANTERCRTVVRNQALDMGADIVVLTTQTVGTGRCDNCVVMMGTVYRRLAPAAAPPPVVVTAGSEAPAPAADPAAPPPS